MNLPEGLTKFGNFYFPELNDAEYVEVMREVNGAGGFENFLRDLQDKVNPATRTIKLTDDIEAIAHYAFDYKQGGFEGRLMRIFARTLGPTLGRDAEPDAAV